MNVVCTVTPIVQKYFSAYAVHTQFTLNKFIYPHKKRQNYDYLMSFSANCKTKKLAQLYKKKKFKNYGGQRVKKRFFITLV